MVRNTWLGEEAPPGFRVNSLAVSCHEFEPPKNMRDDLTPDRLKKKPKSRVRALILIVGVAALAVIVPFWLLEALFNPWAVSLTGAPTLTGEWQGQMTTASGRTYQVDLSIERDIPTGECANCPKIKGEVRTCETGGECRTYRMWGNVDNWRGTRFLLKTLDESEHSGKLTLGYLNGRWSGADTLDLTTELRVTGQSVTMQFERDDAGRETTRVVGGDPDTHHPVTWTMTRARARPDR